jgi:hypothetical protein
VRIGSARPSVGNRRGTPWDHTNREPALAAGLWHAEGRTTRALTPWQVVVVALARRPIPGLGDLAELHLGRPRGGRTIQSVQLHPGRARVLQSADIFKAQHRQIVFHQLRGLGKWPSCKVMSWSMNWPKIATELGLADKTVKNYVSSI